MRRARNSPAAFAGSRARSRCGTIAAPSTIPGTTITAIAASCTASRSRVMCRGKEHIMAQQTVVAPKTKTKTKPQVERPKLWKVILLNDDYTPREFVVMVLKAVFRMNEDQAYNLMMTAHQRGACVIAVFTKDVADTKAKEATELGKSKGYPLFFTTEPEE